MNEDNALDVQIGGDHYKKWRVQPVVYITKKRISFLRGCIIKRLLRDKDSLQDLKKISHELDLLRQIEHTMPTEVFDVRAFYEQDGIQEDTKRFIARLAEEQRLTEEHGPGNEMSLFLLDVLKTDIEQMIADHSTLLSK